MFAMVQKRAENRKECRQYDELSHQSFVARQNESSPCLREWDSLAMYKRIQIVHLTLSDETWAIVISLFFFFYFVIVQYAFSIWQLKIVAIGPVARNYLPNFRHSNKSIEMTQSNMNRFRLFFAHETKYLHHFGTYKFKVRQSSLSSCK